MMAFHSRANHVCPSLVWVEVRVSIISPPKFVLASIPEGDGSLEEQAPSARQAAIAPAIVQNLSPSVITRVRDIL